MRIFYVIVFFLFFAFWLNVIAWFSNIADYVSVQDRIFSTTIFYIACWPSLLLGLAQHEGLSNIKVLQMNLLGWGIIGIIMYFLINCANNNRQKYFNLFKNSLIIFIFGVVLGSIIWAVRNITYFSEGFLLGPIALTKSFNIRGGFLLMMVHIYVITTCLIMKYTNVVRYKKIIVMFFLLLHAIIGTIYIFTSVR